MATRNEVKRFLVEFKRLIDEPGGYIIRNHQKTRDALIQLGWTNQNLTQELRLLTVSDYSSGPNEDEYGRGDYWVFGKMICRIEFYIKLQIRTQRGDDTAVCISFHPAEHPINAYPFRGTAVRQE